MSNEQDSAVKDSQVKGVLLPFKPRVLTPVQGFEFESIPGEIIDIRTNKPIEPPSTIIVYSEDDDKEMFGDTVVGYAKVERDGDSMIVDNIPDATRNTGGIAVKGPQLTLPAGITVEEGENIIRNERGTVWVEPSGKIRMIITSLKNPVHPATGEMLTPPTTATEIQAVSSNTNNLLQFPQSQTLSVEQPLSASSGNPVATPDNLRQFIRPLTDADLKKPA